MERLLTSIVVLLLLLAPAGASAAELIHIKGGQFLMGSPASEFRHGTDETQHTVILSEFYLGKCAVTQKEYQQVMGESPSNFKGDNLPVENVTWIDAIRFCNARSKKEGFTPAYAIVRAGEKMVVNWDKSANGYRLPTEAEWEYACRAGTVTPFNTGDNITDRQANYYGHYPYKNAPRGRYREKTLPVGSFTANSWGLYDMHGNVWEWCWDLYGVYEASSQTDPDGPDSGNFRVNRGGGWNDFGRHLRSAYRAATPPLNRTFNVGFRLARTSE